MRGWDGGVEEWSEWEEETGIPMVLLSEGRRRRHRAVWSPPLFSSHSLSSSSLFLSLSFSLLSILPSFHTPPFLPSFCLPVPSTQTESDSLQEHFQRPPGIEGRRTLLEPAHRHPSWGLAQWSAPLSPPGCGLEHGLACQAGML